MVAVLCDRNAREDSQRTEVKVYCMGGSCWRDIQSFPAFPIEVPNGGGCFISGTLNWLGIWNLNGGVYEWNTVTGIPFPVSFFDLNIFFVLNIFLVPTNIDCFDFNLCNFFFGPYIF